MQSSLLESSTGKMADGRGLTRSRRTCAQLHLFERVRTKPRLKQGDGILACRLGAVSSCSKQTAVAVLQSTAQGQNHVRHWKANASSRWNDEADLDFKGKADGCLVRDLDLHDRRTPRNSGCEEAGSSARWLKVWCEQRKHRGWTNLGEVIAVCADDLEDQPHELLHSRLQLLSSQHLLPADAPLPSDRTAAAAHHRQSAVTCGRRMALFAPRSASPTPPTALYRPTSPSQHSLQPQRNPAPARPRSVARIERDMPCTTVQVLCNCRCRAKSGAREEVHTKRRAPAFPSWRRRTGRKTDHPGAPCPSGSPLRLCAQQREKTDREQNEQAAAIHVRRLKQKVGDEQQMKGKDFFLGGGMGAARRT
eukprot:2240754-Rhodomonas_salina.1